MAKFIVLFGLTALRVYGLYLALTWGFGLSVQSWSALIGLGVIPIYLAALIKAINKN